MDMKAESWDAVLLVWPHWRTAVRTLILRRRKNYGFRRRRDCILRRGEKGIARFLIVKGNYDGLARKINSLIRE